MHKPGGTHSAESRDWSQRIFTGPRGCLVGGVAIPALLGLLGATAAWSLGRGTRLGPGPAAAIGLAAGVLAGLYVALRIALRVARIEHAKVAARLEEIGREVHAMSVEAAQHEVGRLFERPGLFRLTAPTEPFDAEELVGPLLADFFLAWAAVETEDGEIRLRRQDVRPHPLFGDVCIGVGGEAGTMDILTPRGGDRVYVCSDDVRPGEFEHPTVYHFLVYEARTREAGGEGTAGTG